VPNGTVWNDYDTEGADDSCAGAPCAVPSLAGQVLCMSLSGAFAAGRLRHGVALPTGGRGAHVAQG
jgi:hypothetical protein